jgi:hypothetical protein
MPRDIQAGVTQSYVMSPTFYSLYINDKPQTPGIYLGIFADDTCIHATDRIEDYVLRKLQRGFNAIETWCECCGIKFRPSTFLIDLGPLRLILH